MNYVKTPIDRQTGHAHLLAPPVTMQGAFPPDDVGDLSSARQHAANVTWVVKMMSRLGSGGVAGT